MVPVKFSENKPYFLIIKSKKKKCWEFFSRKKYDSETKKETIIKKLHEDPQYIKQKNALK